MNKCGCSDEYGPCETHGEILAQREGASLRTADELVTVFLQDARGIDVGILSPYGIDVLERALAVLDDNRTLGVAWLEDESLADELYSVRDQVESALPDRVVTYWEDGYRIVRLSEDCPLLDN